MIALALAGGGCAPVPAETAEGGAQRGVSAHEQALPQGFGRKLLVAGMADPDALVVGDALYFSGTWDGRVLPIHRLDAAGQLSLLLTLDPSAVDPQFDYCDVWAPDLARYQDRFFVLFAAKRVQRGTACPAPGQDQSIFYTTLSEDGSVFAAPQPFDFGPGAPRSRESGGCPLEGCDKAMRIDVSAFSDQGRTWLSYTYFGGGNHNATFALDAPTRIVHNTTADTADEANITEAPEIFRRGSQYYFLYSAQPFDRAYRMMVLMGSGVEALTEAQASKVALTHPASSNEGQLYECEGHGSIFAWGARHYAIYHQGVFAAGRLQKRDAVLSEVTFAADGRPHRLDVLDLSWNRIDGAEYSLDLRLDGQWVAPCVGADRIGSRTSIRYEGNCTSRNSYAPLHRVDQLRLCYTHDGRWDRAQCETRDLPVASDHLQLLLPHL